MHFYITDRYIYVDLLRCYKETRMYKLVSLKHLQQFLFQFQSCNLFESRKFLFCPPSCSLEITVYEPWPFPPFLFSFPRFLPPLFFHFFLPLPESTSRSFPPRKERTRSEKVTKRERRKVAAAAPGVESRRRPTRVPLPPHPRKRRWGWGEGKVGRRWDSGFLGRQPTRTRGTRTLNESATCRRK